MIATQPLRDEHHELLPHIEFIKETADKAGISPHEELKKSLDEVYEFLTKHLLIHAKAEEKVLYPIIGKLMGAADATKTMSRDHIEIERLIEELNHIRQSEDLKELRRVLYGLYALIKVHFAKEEEIYLPLIDNKLTPQEGETLYKNMEKAAQEERKRLD